jgi:hypothetical protein
MDNEFEPYQINRSALIVTAKQPFVDWLHTVDPTSKDVTLSDINHEPTVYLVPAFEAQDDFMEWLEEYCRTIFAEALDGWWTDTRSWPLDRGITLFQEWFECRLHSMVFDLADEPL